MKPMHPIRGRAAAITIMALAAASAAFAMKVSSNQPAAADPLAGLAVAPEYRCTPYRRGDYPYPQTIEARIVAAQGGHVYGPYTGRTFPSTRHTDIDHIVSLSEAHDSGLCAADPATRRRFTTDLLNLTLAAPAVNRCARGAKCGHDAAGWLPPMNRCWFAARVVEVKRKYGLTVDRREAAALTGVLARCDSTEMIGPAAGAHGAPRTGSRPAGTHRGGRRPPLSMRFGAGTTTATAVSHAGRQGATASRRCLAAIRLIRSCTIETATAWSANNSPGARAAEYIIPPGAATGPHSSDRVRPGANIRFINGVATFVHDQADEPRSHRLGASQCDSGTGAGPLRFPGRNPDRRTRVSVAMIEDLPRSEPPGHCKQVPVKLDSHGKFPGRRGSNGGIDHSTPARRSSRLSRRPTVEIGRWVSLSAVVQQV